MRIYLAGPMRGYRSLNFPAFDEAATRLRKQGHRVFNPAGWDRKHGMVPGRDQPKPLKYYMEHDLAEVSRSEAVAVLAGWEKSQGASLEVHVARVLGIPVLDARTLTEIPVPKSAGEVAVVNAVTGGRKGSKLARFDLLPWDALWALAEHFGKGSIKYTQTDIPVSLDTAISQLVQYCTCLDPNCDPPSVTQSVGTRPTVCASSAIANDTPKRSMQPVTRTECPLSGACVELVTTDNLCKPIRNLLSDNRPTIGAGARRTTSVSGNMGTSTDNCRASSNVTDNSAARKRCPGLGLRGATRRACVRDRLASARFAGCPLAQHRDRSTTITPGEPCGACYAENAIKPSVCLGILHALLNGHSSTCHVHHTLRYKINPHPSAPDAPLLVTISGDRNWQLGIAHSLQYAAMMRHAAQWWEGEDVDAETGSGHLIAVAWHALTLWHLARVKPAMDDRPHGKGGKLGW